MNTEQNMNLDLSSEERAVVADILDSALRDLKEEINKTETFDFKEGLKRREEIIVRLLGRLGSPV
ncbi:MAG TPA: hypothetical protein VHX16_05765 [Chloroflexota bacterium]|nr:hypothetical protein [Chloroflexota bacterium]